MKKLILVAILAALAATTACGHAKTGAPSENSTPIQTTPAQMENTTPAQMPALTPEQEAFVQYVLDQGYFIGTREQLIEMCFLWNVWSEADLRAAQARTQP